jgi:DNA-binding protein YbaB
VTATPSPEQWLADFDATIAAVRAGTEAFRQDLDQAGATESSEDGTLSVTVAPNGALADLRIDDAAWQGSGAELAAEILRLTQRAQRTAAANVAAAFAPLGGDSAAMQMFTGYLR